MPTETELKLEIESAGADALEASGLHRQVGNQVHLVSRYFDTPDFALRRAGLSLRIRQSGAELIQTVKTAGGGGGLLTRGEWDLPVNDWTPQPDERTPLAAMIGKQFAALGEMFAVEVERKLWRFPTPDSEIEVALDRGQVCCGARRESFCEVELELIRGAPAALFAMARGIDAIAPVRLGVLTKPERGYRLQGAMHACVRAERLMLDAGLSLPQAFAAIARDCLGQYRQNEAILLERPGADAVHQARVALRRLRSALSLCRDLLAQSATKALQVRLRHLAASLGDVRDIDVMFCQSQGGPLAPRLADERRQAYARLDALLKLAEPRRLVFDLAEWLEIGDWRYDPATQAVREMPLRQFADAALDRAYRKVRRRIQQYAALSDEQRHELRKDAKKLRYAVEFLRGNYAAPGEMRRRKRFSDALAGLQEDLGAANDRLAAEACLARLGLAGSADAEAMLAQWRLGELVAGAERSGGRLLKVKPFWR